MAARTVEQWKEILNKIEGPTQNKAGRILVELQHYAHGKAYAGSDMDELANALDAYAEIKKEMK